MGQFVVTMWAWLILSVVGAASAQGSIAREIKALEVAYDDTEFEQVTARGNQLLKSTKLQAGERKRIVELIAFSYFYLNKKADAETQLLVLFAVDPGAQIEKRKVTPELALFFEEVRLRSSTAKQAAQEPPAKMPTSPESHELQASPETRATVQPAAPPAPARFRWYGLIPCGIGHFALGDYGIGALFFTLELALIGTSVTLFWLRRSYIAPPDPTAPDGPPRYQDEVLAKNLQLIQNIAAFTAIGVGIISIIDGGTGAQKRSARKRVAPTAMPVQGGAIFGLGGSF